MFRQHIKTAIRNLWKNRAFTTINLVGLTLGLSGIMVLSVMVFQFLQFDQLYKDKDRMYYLKTKVKDGGEYEQTTYPLLAEALKNCPEIEAGTHFQQWYAPWLKLQEKEIQEDRTFFADTGFLNVFSFPLKFGKSTEALRNKFDVVLSEETAEKFFGKDNPVGKTLTADDSIQLTVKAVLKHIGNNNSIRPDVILSTLLLQDYPGFNNNANWYNGFAENYLKLKPGANITKLESQLNQIVKLNYHPERKKDIIRVVPFTERVKDIMGSIGASIISGATGTAIFILLIIIVNLINLNTGTMFSRAKEVAVKQMIGSSKRMIIWQFCIENSLVIFSSLLLAFLLFYFILIPQMNDMFGNQFGDIELTINSDYPLLIVFVLMGTFISILAASYPAWHLTNLKVSDAVKGNISGRSKKSTVRSTFIVLQFVLSITLIYTTIILGRQMNHMKKASTGFKQHDVLVVNLDLAFKSPAAAEARFDALLNTLNSDSRVTGVSTNSVIPTGYQENFNLYSDVVNEKEVSIRHASADAGYFETFGIPMIEGRPFRNVPDSNERNNVIINRSAMKAFGWTTAAGKQLRQKGNTNTFTVIGVCEDFNYRSLARDVEPLLHWYGGKQSLENNYLSVSTREGQTKNVIALLESSFKAMPSRRTFDYEYMTDRVSKQYAMLDNILRMTRYVAFLTIFIACMGMLGLITLFSRQRIKEIGVRKVLGASVTDIVAMLAKNFLLLVSIAAALAAPAAWYIMNGWLQNFAYRIQIEWWMLVVGALAAILIVAVTIGYQSIKAAMSNPVKSLRTE